MWLLVLKASMWAIPMTSLVFVPAACVLAAVAGRQWRIDWACPPVLPGYPLIRSSRNHTHRQTWTHGTYPHKWFLFYLWVPHLSLTFMLKYFKEPTSIFCLNLDIYDPVNNYYYVEDTKVSVLIKKTNANKSH